MIKIRIINLNLFSLFFLLVSNRLLASHDTLFQNIKIIEMFWCLIGRSRHTTLLFKYTNIKNVFGVNPTACVA